MVRFNDWHDTRAQLVADQVVATRFVAVLRNGPCPLGHMVNLVLIGYRPCRHAYRLHFRIEKLIAQLRRKHPS